MTRTTPDGTKASSLFPKPRAPNGALGGTATATKRRARRLDVLAELGPLDTPHDALRRFDTITRLVISGALPGAQASAAVNATKAFVDSHRVAVTVTAVKALETKLVGLEQENARLRARLGERA